MNIRVRLSVIILLSLLNIVLHVSAESESCPAPSPPAPAPAPAPTSKTMSSVSTSIVIDLPGSTSDWVGVLENVKIFLKQLRQVRQLLGTKHFLSELLTTLRVPGAKEHWIKLFEDISLEDIFDFAFGGNSHHILNFTSNSIG